RIDPILGLRPVIGQGARRHLLREDQPLTEHIEILTHPPSHRRNAARLAHIAALALALQLPNLSSHLGFGLSHAVATIRGTICLATDRDPTVPEAVLAGVDRRALVRPPRAHQATALPGEVASSLRANSSSALAGISR